MKHGWSYKTVLCRIVDVEDLPSAEIDSYLYSKSNSIPSNQRQRVPDGLANFELTGKLLSVDGDRILLEIAGQIRVGETDSILNPEINSWYVFEDSIQGWTALSTEESNKIDGVVGEDSMPFTVEHMTPSDGGSAAVGGLGTKVGELTRLIEPSFLAREKDTHPSISKPISGAMFFGPPGTGKTFLARSVAQQTSAQLITVNGPELISKWVGATERVLRELFAHADKYERSIIFFDEFDTVGARRGPDTHDFVNRQVGQLLATMDGATRTKRPFVIAATNRLEDVDPAFLRPGRFDYPMEFTIPSATERAEILLAQSRAFAVLSRESLGWLTAHTNAWSPAELGLIWTEAESSRNRDDRARVTLEDVLFGFERARSQHDLLERTNDAWALEKTEKKQ